MSPPTLNTAMMGPMAPVAALPPPRAGGEPEGAPDQFARALDEASKPPPAAPQRSDHGGAPANGESEVSAYESAAARTARVKAPAPAVAERADDAPASPDRPADEVAATPPADVAALIAGWLARSQPAGARDAAANEDALAQTSGAATTALSLRTETPSPGQGQAAQQEALAPADAVAQRAPEAMAPLASAVAAPLAGAPPGAGPAGTTSAPVEAQLRASPGSAEFAPQLGAQLSVFVREGVQHARLHLHPAELGPLTVQIQLEGATAQVHLAAEHPLTRQALEQAMPTLASALRDAGLTLTGGGVFEQPRQPQDQRAPARGPGHPLAAGDASATGEAAAALPAVALRRGVVDLIA